MKVSELIEELKKIDQDAVVKIFSNEVMYDSEKSEHIEGVIDGINEPFLEDGKLVVYLEIIDDYRSRALPTELSVL